MRMWMIDPEILDDKHLNGEHHELHLFAGTISKQRSISGYVRNNLVEPSGIVPRHAELVKEMLKRGFSHNSPLDFVDLSYLNDEERDYKIDVAKSMHELFKKCPACKQRYEKKYGRKTTMFAARVF